MTVLYRSQIAFKQRENIEVYLKAARKYGQEEVDSYQVLTYHKPYLFHTKFRFYIVVILLNMMI